MKRPYVILKAATSLDGFLDDTSSERAVFSSPEDSVAVDHLRASVDAIFIGAETLRRDKAALLVKDDNLREDRLAAGLSENPIKVTLSSTGNLPVEAPFFTAGKAKKIVYVTAAVPPVSQNETDLVRVTLPETNTLETMLADLEGRGVKRLLVEGGGKVLQEFIHLGAWNEFRLAVAPVVLGDKGRVLLFENSLTFDKMKIRSVSQLGQMSVIIIELK